eukprot:CAMPEP_0206434630 /NCGR_PEP_ID=MMETSP0324_2-20121206/9303_1 /ASSEMBLY_ACC=CAM_ASM_000836 /TAXON_ID=2866 /ORGANISM="Crypthecodinium cohnii, Strain Seligo" /LENGTH=66 /DNA_ID=CAMNT_0053901243 /DNA_START=160 /DNA_END=360 /DNA_ORIENTATION=-
MAATRKCCNAMALSAASWQELGGSEFGGWATTLQKSQQGQQEPAQSRTPGTLVKGSPFLRRTRPDD